MRSCSACGRASGSAKFGEFGGHKDLGFRVEDLGFRVEDLGFRVEGLGFRI